MESPHTENLTPQPDEDIRKLMKDISSITIEAMGQRVITAPHIRIYGESNHSLRPRAQEMIEQARSATRKPTHIIMEISGNRQEIIDAFLNGTVTGSELRSTVTGLREADIILLEYARQKGIKIIAGDMSQDQMKTWLEENSETVNSLNNTIKDPLQRATTLAVLMEQERSLVTGKKIRSILYVEQDAEIMVNCGALHVQNILKGIYGIENEITPKPQSKKASNEDLFAAVERLADKDPRVARLQGILNQLKRTRVDQNEKLLQNAINSINECRDVLTNNERAGIFLRLSQSYVLAVSPMRIILEKLAQDLENTKPTDQ